MNSAEAGSGEHAWLKCGDSWYPAGGPWDSTKERPGFPRFGVAPIPEARHQEPPRMSNRETMRTTLMNLLEQEMGEPCPTLTDDQDLRESLNLDSVDVVGLVMRIEREYRVRLAPEELAGIQRVGDLLDLMEAKLAAGPRQADDGEPAAS